MLSIKSIKPNPNYVPGGVENFWLTASTTSEKKDGEKGGGERGPGFTRFTPSYETEKSGGEETSQHPQTDLHGGGKMRGSFTRFET